MVCFCGEKYWIQGDLCCSPNGDHDYLVILPGDFYPIVRSADFVKLFSM